MNKKAILLLLSGLLIVLAAVGYFLKADYYNNHFLPNTTINTLDVSNLTAVEANQKLVEKADENQFVITDKEKSWKEMRTSSLGVEYDFKQKATDLLAKQNKNTWLLSYLSDHKHTIESNAINEKVLNSALDELSKEVKQLNEQRTPSKNASIEQTDKGFQITPEVYGDAINVTAFIKELKNNLTQGKHTIEMEAFVDKPSVTEKDESLTKELEHIHSITKQTVTYHINGETINVPAETITSWVIYDSKEKHATLDQTAVLNYLTSLAEKYNTSSQPTKFASSKRGTVTVPAGSYSWSIATETEAAALTADLTENKSVDRSPAYQGSASPDSPLIGNTYIEVDLDNQHMWYYKDGKVVLETDIVSGKPKTLTPHGVFYVWNKERNATLRGTNDDGSKYASPVDYWMPVDWTGVGIHDSDWQPEYGGDLWKTRGSHGCINTPPAIMKQLFEKVEVGTPVLIF
ncbi:L,D-transpeptidase family protein [Vagococcus xieshaowenii]|nr:L,D-transpeptidase family protein [Vagococcus xieshaowenii]